MNENITVLTISPSELKTMIEESIEYALNKIDLKQEVKPPDQVLMTRHEAIELLDISSVTLHNWMKQGKLRFRRIGRRIYFLKSEILEDIQQYNKL